MAAHTDEIADECEAVFVNISEEQTKINDRINDKCRGNVLRFHLCQQISYISISILYEFILVFLRVPTKKIDITKTNQLKRSICEKIQIKLKMTSLF